MNRIELLPIWTLSDGIPSVYDTTSGTYQEMVAKVYGAMRTLQLDYNSFANDINGTITKFINDANVDQEQFENEINQIIHDYIITIDTKIAHQDRVIEENIAFIRDNLASEVTRVINEMKDNGELDVIIGDAIGGLGTRVETLESSVTTMNNELAEISTNVSNDITEFETRVNESIQYINTKTNDIQTDVNLLKNKNVGLIYHEDTKSCNLVIDGNELILNEDGE